MSELKPCPFCGAAPTIKQVSEEAGSGIAWVVDCLNDATCQQIPSAWGDTREEAVAKWNTRPIEAALTAELAAAKIDVKRTAALAGDLAIERAQSAERAMRLLKHTAEDEAELERAEAELAQARKREERLRAACVEAIDRLAAEDTFNAMRALRAALAAAKEKS